MNMHKSAMTPEDMTLIKRYLVGGAALGGGAALVTSLLNHLQDSRRAADYDKDEDNNALHLTLRQKAPVPKLASLRAGLGMAGMGLSAAAAYALVRGLYQKYKAREAQAELDKAEHGYIDVLDPATGQKQAHVFGGGLPSITMLTVKMASPPAPAGGKPMGPGEHIMGLPILGALLTALATGAISYHALKKQFPASKPAVRLGPKRVVIDRQISSGGDEPPADATISTSKLARANQWLLEAVSTTSPGSQTAEFVNAVADGRLDELHELAKMAGMTAVYDAVKNAACNRPQAVFTACRKIAQHPYFGETAPVMAAADYAAVAPVFFKAAATATPEDIEMGIELCAGLALPVA